MDVRFGDRRNCLFSALPNFSAKLGC
jgi:hypothetical protein